MPQTSKMTAKELRVIIYWGDILYATAVCSEKRPITIGPKQGSTLVADLGLGQSVIELAKLDGKGGAIVKFSPEMRGHLRLKGQMLSLENACEQKIALRSSDGLFATQLSTDDKADIVLGLVSFSLSWAQESPKLPLATIKDDKEKLWWLAPILASVLAIVGVQFIPHPEVEKPPERLVTLLPPPRLAPAKAAVGERKTKDGGAEKGELGKADLAPKAKVIQQVRNIASSTAESLRKANLGNIFSGLTSISDTASQSAPNASSRAGAAASITQEGTGGFSTEGLKTGGGGKTVGIGRSVGRGEGGFEGTGRLGLSGNAAVEGGTGYGGDSSKVIEGGLDPAVIESIIKRRQDRIRLCYERQLNFNPKLSGKVAVHFVIDGKGSVSVASILEDTMKSVPVNTCIISEVKSWTFPPPKGGVKVPANYPFVFESSTRMR